MRGNLALNNSEPALLSINTVNTLAMDVLTPGATLFVTDE
jgi:hypothetical protein